MTQLPPATTRRVLVLASLPALVLLDSAVAVARGWRPTTRTDIAAISLAVLALLAPVLMLARPRGRRVLERMRTKLVVVLVSFSCAWGIADVVVGPPVVSQFNRSGHRHKPHDRRLFRPAAGTMPGVEGTSRFTINALGLRAPELPPREMAYRVLCIGGSTTICMYLDDDETWPSLLARRLSNDPGFGPTWIGNAGFSGNTTVHHLEFVTTCSLIEEMNCVVILGGINDFLPAVYGDSELLQRTGPDVFAPVWRRSVVLQWVRKGWRKQRQNDGIWNEDPAGARYVDRRQRRQFAVETDASPELTTARCAYEDRLRALVATITGKGVRVVLVSQPTLWSASLTERSKSLLWMGEMKDGRFLSPGTLAAGIDLFNESLIKVCNETGTRCVDLRGLNGREDLFYDDCHFNEAGAREVADLIAAHSDALK